MTKKIPLTRQDKERKVIELYEKGTNIRNIAEKVHMSFGDIGEIIRKYSGDERRTEKSRKYSKHSQALELFRTGASNLEVATKLGLTDSETMDEHKQYRRLTGDDKFCNLYDRMEGKLEPILLLNDQLRNANLTIRDAIEGVTYARNLNSMKLEFDGLWNASRRLKQQNYWDKNLLKALKQDINSASIELEVMKEAKDAVWNEIDGVRQRSQEIRQM